MCDREQDDIAGWSKLAVVEVPRRECRDSDDECDCGCQR